LTRIILHRKAARAGENKENRGEVKEESEREREGEGEIKKLRAHARRERSGERERWCSSDRDT